MKLKATIHVAAACLLLCGGTVQARTLHIPGEYNTFAVAVQNARNTDTVLVANGTYRGADNLNIRLTSPLTILSEDGPAQCIIDGEGTANVRSFIMATGSRLIGFTITGMTLNCVLDSAIQNFLIQDCNILANINRAGQQSVGVKVSQSTGGVIEHCIFQQNASGTGGAAIPVTSSSRVRIWDCIFDQNETIRFGGAVWTNTSSFTDIGNCIFNGNFAGTDGGACAYSQQASGTVHNCTFINNQARAGMGGGLYKGSQSNPRVLNCIFWGNSAAQGNQLCQQNTAPGDGGSITISYCLVEGGIDQNPGGWNGDHILSDPPAFVQGREPAWGLNWFYLDPASPAVNAGNTNANVDSVGMDSLFTNPDFSLDQGVVDLGFHYNPNSYIRVGGLYGQVLDAGTGQGLAGAVVRTSRRVQAQTDNNGYWAIHDHKIGICSLTYTYPGYLDSTIDSVFVPENDSVREDVSLLHTEFTPSIQEISVPIPANDSSEVDFNVTNGGTGTLIYTAVPHLVGDADIQPWAPRESFRWGQTADDDRLNGFIFIDSLYYVAGSNGLDTNLVYIFDRGGALLDSFPQSATSTYGYKQLAWDGQELWGSGDSLVFGFSRTGELLHRWRAPFTPVENIAWDPDRQVLWISSVTGNIVAYDREGNSANINLGFSNVFRKYGLFYWPQDPDHHPLYVIHRPTGNINKIYKIDPETRDTMFVDTLHSPDGDFPMVGMQIVPYDLFSVVFMSLVKATRADGRDRLQIWQLAGNTSWMRLNPTRGQVPAGNQEFFTLILNMNGFPTGRFYGQIKFYHNALDNEFDLPIQVIVQPNAVKKGVELLPNDMRIEDVYPNPFNGTTRLSYLVPEAGRVRLTIHDLAGREVMRLADGWMPAGHYEASLDAVNWPSSVYIAKLSAGGKVRTAKLVLMK